MQVGASSGGRRRSDPRLILYGAVSGTCMLVQALLTEYGPDGAAQAMFWLLVGLALLWFTARRKSRLARAVIVITAFLGIAIYMLSRPTDAHAWLLAALYAGQALPLMTPTVRRHVNGSQEGAAWAAANG